MSTREQVQDKAEEVNDASTGEDAAAEEFARRFFEYQGIEISESLPTPENSSQEEDGSDDPAEEADAASDDVDSDDPLDYLDLIVDDEDDPAPAGEEQGSSITEGQAAGSFGTIAQKLGLAEDATEEQVLDALDQIVKYRSEADRLRAEAADAARRNAEALRVLELLENDPHAVLEIAADLAGGTITREELRAQLGGTPASDESSTNASIEGIDEIVAAKIQEKLGGIDLEALEELRRQQELREAEAAISAEFDRIEKSLGKKFSPEQRQKFLQHAARLELKYTHQLEAAVHDALAKAQAKAAEKARVRGAAPSSPGANGGITTAPSDGSFLAQAAEKDPLAAAMFKAKQELATS